MTRSATTSMGTAISLLVCGLCIAASGCEGPKKVWSAESLSPDGKMIASARTIVPSGIGTGNFGTFVDLNWTKGSQAPAPVLVFSDGADQSGDTSVGMKWLSPTHLELTYKGQRTIDFQAVKCHGIDISVRDLSGDKTSISK